VRDILPTRLRCCYCRRPHLRSDSAHSHACHVGTRTGLAPLPHLYQDSAARFVEPRAELKLFNARARPVRGLMLSQFILTCAV
jgi:hypothetical protein